MKIEDIKPEDLSKFDVLMVPKNQHRHAMRNKYRDDTNACVFTVEEDQTQSILEAVVWEAAFHNSIALAWDTIEDHENRAEESVVEQLYDAKLVNLKPEHKTELVELAKVLGRHKGEHAVDIVQDAMYEDLSDSQDAYRSTLDLDLSHGDDMSDDETLAYAMLNMLYAPMYGEGTFTPDGRISRCHGHMLDRWPEGDVATLAALFEESFLMATFKTTAGKIGDR